SGQLLGGIWFGQKDDKATVVIATAKRRAEIDHTSFVPDANVRVVLKGELLIPADRMQAVVTSGVYGFSECSFDPQAALPHLVISCPTRHQDRAARIQAAAFPSCA